MVHGPSSWYMLYPEGIWHRELTQLYLQTVKQTLSCCSIPAPGLHIWVLLHSRAWALENYPVSIWSAAIYIVVSCNLFLILQWKAWHSALINNNLVYFALEACPGIWEQGRGGRNWENYWSGVMNPNKAVWVHCTHVPIPLDIFEVLMWWDHLLPHHNSMI